MFNVLIPKKLFFSALLLIAQMLVSQSAFSAVAIVVNMSGVLSAKQADGSIKALSEKSEVEEGDILSTEKNSYARLKFSDGGELTMRPDSTLKIDSYHYDTIAPEKDNFVFSLLKGGFRTITGLVGKRGNRDAYRLKTATATIGIRGTNYGGLLCSENCAGVPAGLYLDVLEGAINASNDGGNIDLTAGQFGFASSFDRPPVQLPKNPDIPKFDVDSAGSKTVEGGGARGAGCLVQ